MARVKNNKIFKKYKYCFLLLTIITFVLIFGIQTAYAYYYNDSDSLPILSNLIGDFDLGEGDINIVIFKETGVDSNEFVKTYIVPEVGYSFNVSKTSCKSPISNSINCEKDNPNANCNYKFDEETKEIDLTSNQKVTCKFYFDKDYENDIELYVMMQDANGTHTYNDKTYRNVDNMPAYGFNFSSYYCKNGSTVEIDQETGNLKVKATQRDVCYAYFDGDLHQADIIANVYVQKVVGGDYTKVSTIPNAQKYKLSEVQNSYCHTEAGIETGVVPTYEDFMINIPDTNQKQICEVYLDIDNS